MVTRWPVVRVRRGVRRGVFVAEIEGAGLWSAGPSPEAAIGALVANFAVHLCIDLEGVEDGGATRGG